MPVPLGEGNKFTPRVTMCDVAKTARVRNKRARSQDARKRVHGSQTSCEANDILIITVCCALVF